MSIASRISHPFILRLRPYIKALTMITSFARRQSCKPSRLPVGYRSVGFKINCPRFLSSKPDKEMFQLPDPSWSVKDLELSIQHEPVTQEELNTLARRSLLKIDPETAPTLRQDLGNMLHVIQQVTSFDSAEQLSDEEIYDDPRGVTAAPLRQDTSIGEGEESAAVWESLLKPRTTKLGAHHYFAIATKKGS